jgi:hypothetical protein
VTKTVRFLGYDRTRTRLIGELESRGVTVLETSEPVADLSGADANIAFGYRHIIPEAVLRTAARPVLNLHIAYLPYNRGAHPNFWALYENTPSGVTIHEIDAGIDTGPVCFQRYVNFAPAENTLAQTHARLVRELEQLFVENIDALLSGDYSARPQRGIGSFHKVGDLPEAARNWDAELDALFARLDREGRLQQDLGIIDEIQQVRTKNNVNWMDLLRIAIKNAPEETKAVLRRINSDDNKISDLFKKLGEK